MYDFPVNDCIHEQTPSPYFFPSTFDDANSSLCQKNVVEIQKFCYSGNLTSHFSIFLNAYNEQETTGKRESKALAKRRYFHETNQT